MKDFFFKIQDHKDQNLPFVIYSKPNSSTIVAVLQQNERLYEVVDYKENGFVFASFDESKLILLPESSSSVITTVFEECPFEIAEDIIDSFNINERQNFEQLVDKGIKAIEDGVFKKVVLSRSEQVELANFDFITTFKHLVQLYPTAFTYCFFHPKVGMWMGAPPEKLLRATAGTFETMALAGTQKAEDLAGVSWGQKEIDEQQFVTDFIEKRLKKVSLDLKVGKSYTYRAGSIFHIRTDITGQLHENTSIAEIIHSLHPTPAMCGLPKKVAKQFIVENEGYDRLFYSGFLGELNCNYTSNSNNTDLYVNLRCMNINANVATLYMGCGVTRESVPAKEWEESVNKSMTIKRVLRSQAKK